MRNSLIMLLLAALVAGCDATQFDGAPQRRNESVKGHLQKYSGLQGVYFSFDPGDSIIHEAVDVSYHLNLEQQLKTREDSGNFLKQIMDPRYMEVRLQDSRLTVRRFGICSRGFMEQFFKNGTAPKDSHSESSLACRREKDSIYFTSIGRNKESGNNLDTSQFSFSYTTVGDLLCIYSDQKGDLPDHYNLDGLDEMRYLTTIADDLYDVKTDTTNNNTRYSISQIKLGQNGFKVSIVKCDSALKFVADSLGLSFNGRFHFEEEKLASMFSSQLARPYLNCIKIRGFELPGTQIESKGIGYRWWLVVLVFVIGLLAIAKFMRRTN